MSDLYPTKTRLALLRAVADGHVWVSYGPPHWYGESYAATGDSGRRKVTARIDALSHAGWVELDPPNYSGAYRRYWRLTDAGRAVLDTHGGQRDGRS